MKKSIVILSILLTSQFCAAQERAATRNNSPVDFFKEDITLSVADSFASVSGTYYFRNNTERDGKMPVMFPFYVDSSSLYPDTISIFVISGNDSTRLDYRNARERNSIIIGIPLFSKLITIWHLDYRQKILGNKATYILTSTAAWGAPLEEATYKFIVPSSYEDVHVWPEADTVIANGKMIKYEANRSNLMPAQNMTIEWK